MARKRPSGVVDVSSNEDSDDSDSQDTRHGRLRQRDKISHDFLSDDDSDMEGSDSDSIVHFNKNLYEQCLKDIKRLKKKMTTSLKHKSEMPRVDNKSKDAFTRFSVQTFSSLIKAMSPNKKKVIVDSGLGSLLEFDKCYVPNKFVKWIACLVNYKSGDIIIDGKVISLTKESIHLILGLPIGGAPFPSGSTAAKSQLLSKYNKDSVPKVTFFEKKLTSSDAMSDEDVLICFVMVAMSSFLCPNSSLVPSTKYFGILEDIKNLNGFDWSAFVLQWLLEHIKTFNKCKFDNGQTLGGCIYYLAVVYLDHVHFGSQQPPDDIPRIKVWRGNMIKYYSNLDLVSPGVYGLRPLLEISQTCYSQKTRFLQNPSYSLHTNEEFLDQLDTCCCCKIPDQLKLNICKLIEHHCFNSSLTMNMNISSLASLSSELKHTFSTLLEHAYKIDKNTQNLVLNLLKLITDFEFDDHSPSGSIENAVTYPHSNNSSNLERQDQTDNINSDVHMPSNFHNEECNFQDNQDHESNYDDQVQLKETSRQSIHSDNEVVSPKKCDTQTTHHASPFAQLPVHNLNPLASGHSTPKLNNEEVEVVMRKLKRKDPSEDQFQTPKKFIFSPSGYPSNRGPEALYKKTKARLDAHKKCVTETDIASVRNPLCDISNDSNIVCPPKSKSVTFASIQDEDKDIISLDNEDEAVQHSFSPLDINPYPRFSSQQCANDSDHATPEQTRRTNVSMVSPEVVITGERSLGDTMREMSMKSEALYVSQQHRIDGSNVVSTPCASNINSGPSSFHSVRDATQGSSVFESINSTGGKLPPCGPRRAVFPTAALRQDFVHDKAKYQVSKIEAQNYRAICRLANSKWQTETAVDIGGVKCTYWSLGESLKPGGVVNTFVVAVFCYHLYSKPNGHPDTSKIHYYFPNIGVSLPHTTQASRSACT